MASPPNNMQDKETAYRSIKLRGAKLLRFLAVPFHRRRTGGMDGSYEFDTEPEEASLWSIEAMDDPTKEHSVRNVSPEPHDDGGHHRRRRRHRRGAPSSSDLSSSARSDSTMSIKTAMQMTAPDAASLLRLSDSVRASLAASKSLGPSAGKLVKILELLVSDEENETPMVLEYKTIVEARLDKLLDDLLDPFKKPVPAPPRHFAVLRAATALQKRWKSRFKDKYLDMDEVRQAAMQTTGCLRNVTFCAVTDDGFAVWEAKSDPSLYEARLDPEFEIGHWWPNVACAHRDGLVGSVLERVTKGRCGVSALPLLTGEEEFQGTHVSRYTRKSESVSDMHVSLMSLVGKEIHVLRGYRLKSIHAPVGGVRYDGRYKIKSWDIKLIAETGIYHLTLDLKRRSGQKSMDTLKKIPKPSQLDDWCMYEMLEAEKINKSLDERSSLDWLRKREAEKAEREVWQRLMEYHGEELRDSPQRRPSSVKLALPDTNGTKIVDPQEEPSPKGSET